MIFKRALRRELLSTAGAVFTTLFMITITFMLIRILAQAAGGKIASEDVLVLIGYASLDYVPIILILTGFISVLLVVTRSYQDSEMVVWFASGLSLTDWIRPVLGFALPIVGLVGALSLVVSPWANKQREEVTSRYEKRTDIAKVAVGKFQEWSSSGHVSFVEEISADMKEIKNIFINQVKDGRTTVIVAKQGKIEIDVHGDKFLVMSKGQRYDGLPTEGDFQTMQFEKYAVLVSSANVPAAGAQSAKSLSLQSLVSDPSPIRDGELLWRISLPLMGLLLMLLAIPLGFVNPRVGRSANLIVALVVVAINLNALNSLQALVVQGRLRFWQATWPLHATVFCLICGYFLWRLQLNSRWHPSGIWCRLKYCIKLKSDASTLDTTAGAL
ncbi:MAG: LPS export ABC transporter permease LptF [Undibacterium sp.]|nr:LPS export ABC transporter permease LptF [Undibacterium sp.]